MNTPESTADAAHVVLSVERDGVMHVERDSLPIVPAGEVLAEHEVYIDVINRGHGPFRALTGQTAGSGNGYVAELSVDSGVWDLLMREDGEAQLLIEESQSDSQVTDGYQEYSSSGEGFR